MILKGLRAGGGLSCVGAITAAIVLAGTPGLDGTPSFEAFGGGTFGGDGFFTPGFANFDIKGANFLVGGQVSSPAPWKTR